MLLHPVTLVALTALVINDHVLKVVMPGALTGKLSDVAGLVVFPLLLLALAELTRPSASRPRVLALAIVATAVAFFLVKTTDAGGAAFGWGLGAMQWVITIGPVRGATLAPVANVVDPTDLMALPALFVAWWIAGARFRRSPQPGVRTRPSAAALSVLILAGLATAATSQGAPTTSAELEVELHLTKDAPVAVRHLDLTIAKGEDTIASVAFTASLLERIREGTNEYQDSSNARLSLIADRSDIQTPFEQGYISPALDLTALCAMGCEHGVTLVARLAPGADRADVKLNASVYVSDDYREVEDQSMDSTISLMRTRRPGSMAPCRTAWRSRPDPSRLGPTPWRSNRGSALPWMTAPSQDHSPSRWSGDSR